MRFYIYLILLGLFSTSQAHAWENFYFFKPGELQPLRPLSQTVEAPAAPTCRDNIRKAICVVNSAQDPRGPRHCLPGGEALATPIEKIYDIVPEKVQKAFCSLDVIYVENDMESLAYAGIIRYDENDQPLGAVMGIRRILLEQAYDATSVFGWKEQKAFGLQAPPFVHLPEGPRVDVALPGSLSALHYVLVHEIGHILDFSNTANSFICGPGETCNLDSGRMEEYLKMVPAPASWASLSWKSTGTPKDEYNFPLWKKLCFYGCTERLEVADIEPFYAQLAPTNFVTTYAAVSPFEDFAESFTFYILSLQGEWTYQIQTPTTAYSLDKKWTELNDKKTWMDSFYNRDLKYPSPIN
ncbi:hypothetical protein QJS83_09860 [Bdellovibrio sp. 22V]|uniref:hypothetical protein n=1 Tax=Bdellovibrio TaxID=958 RepID=UPI0025427F1E|nr:hypothetical protein [Bdellovibrio sp. 22V]WII70764.1 hypothetical protein QJS83_09860 [Bdellovibrio sp. 22V]